MADISLHGSALRYRTEAAGFLTKRIAKGLVKQFTITSAQLLALNATPISILAAPGAGLVNVVRGLHLYKQAGTAYAGIAAGEDFAVRYTNASGTIAASLEATGFLDSTSATHAVGVTASVAVAANAALVLHMQTGEVITGTGDLFGWLEYDTYPFALDLLSLA